MWSFYFTSRNFYYYSKFTGGISETSIDPLPIKTVPCFNLGLLWGTNGFFSVLTMISGGTSSLIIFKSLTDIEIFSIEFSNFGVNLLFFYYSV